MELLKFSDSPKSTRRGKNPAAFIGAGIMVAVMGLSSTLAGTISINSGATVEFGQGIVSTAACDESIDIVPTSTYDYSSGDVGVFRVTSITIDRVGWDSGVAGAISADGRGCRGQVLELRAFGSTNGEPLPFHSDSASVGEVLTVYIPETSVSGADLTNGLNFVKRAYNYTLSGGTVTIDNTADYSPTLTVSGTMAGAQATDAGMKITVGGLKLSADVVRFTLESRSARASTDEKS